MPAPGTPGVFGQLCGLDPSNPLNLTLDGDGFVAFRTLLNSPDLQDCNRGGSLCLIVRGIVHAPELPADHAFDNLPGIYLGPAGGLGNVYISVMAGAYARVAAGATARRTIRSARET